MKKYLLFASLFVSFLSYCQVTVELPGGYLKNELLKSNISQVNYKGSPYLSEGFSYGKIIVDNDKIFKKNLRFNAYSDVFEIKNNGRISGLIKSKNVKVLLNGELYQLFSYPDKGIEKDGYFVNLNPKGTKISLLLKNEKEFIEAKKATNSYSDNKPAKFIYKKLYFIKKGNKLPVVEIRLSKKSVLKALKNQKQAILSFIKNNKLKLRNEKDVVKLFNYYNTL